MCENLSRSTNRDQKVSPFSVLGVFFVNLKFTYFYAFNFSNFEFVLKDELWCELVLAFGVNQRRIDMSNVIKKAADKAVIHEVKNIRKAVNGKIKVRLFGYCENAQATVIL